MSFPASSAAASSPDGREGDGHLRSSSVNGKHGAVSPRSVGNTACAGCSGGKRAAHSNDEEVYHILTPDTVLLYAERTLAQWAPLNPPADSNKAAATAGDYLLPGELVRAEEVGDGNLNLVFRLLDRNGVSRAVLKQSLPYVRCVGESWPLTLDRNRLEADTLLSHFAFAPDTTEKVLFHNSTMAVTVVEDLSDMVIWRSELVKARHHPHVVPQLADYLARVHFFTSDFAQHAAEKKAAVRRVTNVDMCQITEDLFFADPYVVHDRNNCEPELEPFVAQFLRADASLKVRVAQLTHTFMNKAEAHIHGDIHSGSVFIDATRVKAIDAKFGFYGPMGFDVGSVLGNLLMNYIAVPALVAQQQRRKGKESSPGQPASRAPTTLPAGTTASRAILLESAEELWRRYAETFLALAATPGNVRDVSFAFPGYAEAFLHENVLPDSVGFAGAEMVRRTVGLAHVADLDDIENKEERLAAKEKSLRLGAALIKKAKSISSFQDVLELIKSDAY